jgi:hypothetical protein
MDKDEVINSIRCLSPVDQKEVMKTIMFDYIDGGMIAELLEIIVEIEKEVR